MITTAHDIHTTVRRILARTVPALSVLAFVVPNAGHAQDSRPLLEEVVVTASKRQEPLREVAGGVNAATGDFLEGVGAQSMADYAAFVPGLRIQGSGRPGYSAIALRGLTALSVGASTGTYVDDVPLGSSNNYSSGAITGPDIDPNDLERVEVLKGPQGTLYGASSLGGLVKYVTRAPDLAAMSGYASAGLKSVDHGGTGYEARGGLNLPLIEGKLGTRFNIADRQNAGFIDNVYTGENDINTARTRSARAQLLYRPAERFSARLSAAYQESKGDAIAAVDASRTLELTHGDLETSRQLNESNEIVDQVYAMTLDYDFDWATLTSATGYSRVDSDPISDYSLVYPVQYAAFVPAGSTSPVLAGTYTSKWTQELRLASPSNGHLEWLVGAFYQSEDSSTNQNFRIIGPDGTPAPGLYGTIYQNFYATSLDEIAGFGNVTYYITPQFDVTAGYRYSRNDQDISRSRTGLIGNPAAPTTFRTRAQSSSEGVSTYLLTTRWRPTTDTMFYARAASGYRPGGPRDIAPGSDPGPGFVYSFKADTVWNYEVGVRSGWWNNRVTADLSAFRINWSDIQALAPVITPSGTFMVFDNAGNAVSKGFEFTSQIRPMFGLTFTTTVGYTDATLSEDNAAFSARKGDSLTNIPKWTGALNADYQVALPADWQGVVGASYRYTAKTYTQFSLSPQRVELPSYDVVDLRLGAKLDSFTAMLYLRNLTDERGYTSASNLSSSLPYALAVIEPRSIGVMLTKTY